LSSLLQSPSILPYLPLSSELVIIGAGGFGRETAALVETINETSATWLLRGFLDDDASLHGTQIMGYPVHGDLGWMTGKDHLHFVAAIGAPDVRRVVARRAMDMGGQPASLVHPAVALHRTTQIGEGSIVCGGCHLTVDIQIEPYALLNLQCTVGHDTQIRKFATIHPGVRLSGNTTVGAAAEIGSGAITLPGTTVGDGAIVGAGAVVTQDLPSGCTAVGVPARPLSA